MKHPFLNIYVVIAIVALVSTRPARAQPHSDAPLRTPLYSIDTGSPTAATVPTNALLGKPGPHVIYPASTFGLGPTDELDGMSGAYNISDSQQFLILFCVDRASVGAMPPDPTLAGSNR